MTLTLLALLGGAFLVLLGVLIGTGLYTEHRKFVNDAHAREVRERREARERERRSFL